MECINESADRFTFSGTVNKEAWVFINGEERELNHQEDGTYTYSMEVAPTHGVNTVVVKVIDLFGNVAEQTFTVNY